MTRANLSTLSSVRESRIWLSAGIWLVLHGCAHERAVAPPAPAAPQSPPVAAGAEHASPKPARSPTEPFSAFMSDHFLIVTYARDAVISGDIDGMREPLTVLADYRYDSVAPGGWLPFATELQTLARMTAKAESLDAAAAGIATLGRLCGDCHVAQGRGPSLGPLAPVSLEAEDDPSSLPAIMDRHSRGADQLWLGLTAPSDKVWRAGAKTIAEIPELGERGLPPDFAGALAEIRQLGPAAQEAETSAARADLYGELLSTCAGCHARLMSHDIGALDQILQRRAGSPLAWTEQREE